MAEPDRDFYQILHVSHDAPVEIIRASYRTLMQQLKQHPDLGGDADSAAAINEAYAILRDPRKRALYDARLSTPKPQSTPAPAGAAEERPRDLYRECVFCCTPHNYRRAIPADARCGVCHSPLAPAEATRLEERDARAVARIQKRQGVDLLMGWPSGETWSGRTEDLSLSGMRLVTRSPLHVGQLLRVKSLQLESVARVVNVVERALGSTVEHESGLAFVTLMFSTSLGTFVSDQF